jgi:hypothetical protein
MTGNCSRSRRTCNAGREIILGEQPAVEKDAAAQPASSNRVSSSGVLSIG